MGSYPQQTKLNLKTKIAQNGKCRIEDSYFTPPLKIMSPFYQENGVADIMLIAVSAGLLKGDEQEIKLDIGQDCKVKLSSQSFEKIYDTQDGFAYRETQIHIRENALLDFSPLPIIPFKNSDFRARTDIFLEKNSSLIYSEILCAGRVGRDEIFKFKNFCSHLNIYQDKEALFFDNTILEPSSMDLKNMCLFGDFTHYLNLVLFTPLIDGVEKIKDILESSYLNVGFSELAKSGICIKALADNSEDLLKLRDKISRVICI